MTTIRFLTTPKYDLTHYPFITQNPYQSVTELNIYVCSRLGTMLYLEIQKGKDMKKIAQFQKYIGGTVAYMKIIIRVTNGCGQLSSNNTLFSDLWFSGVNTV